MTTTTTSGTRYATSADGTEIAYDVNGSGPALVIVEGALCHRGMGTAKSVRDSLGDHFKVHAYDRRGRGESGPGVTAYEVQREVEDLIAVLDVAGSDARVFGCSSGAALALEAARQGVPMTSLAVYEAPFIVDDTHVANDPQLADRVQAMVDAGEPGEAVKLFMRTVGVPAFGIVMMQLLPVWKGLKAVAHTLPNDLTIVLPFEQGKPLPAGHYASVTVPTLVIAGGKSPEYMRNAQAAIADQIPDARLVTLAGQTHMVKPRATTPALVGHFLPTGG
ncbi:MAG: putative hydrolase [Marmoricola sp.]|nr:putative hydrolase [Marmoricola sp.]